MSFLPAVMGSLDEVVRVLSEAAGDEPMADPKEEAAQPSTSSPPTPSVTTMSPEALQALAAAVREEQLRRALTKEKNSAFNKENLVGDGELPIGDIGLPMTDRTGRGGRLMDECVMCGALLSPGRICCSYSCFKRLEAKNRNRIDGYCVHSVSRTPDWQPDTWFCR